MKFTSLIVMLMNETDVTDISNKFHCQVRRKHQQKVTRHPRHLRNKTM